MAHRLLRVDYLNADEVAQFTFDGVVTDFVGELTDVTIRVGGFDLTPSGVTITGTDIFAIFSIAPVGGTLESFTLANNSLFAFADDPQTMGPTTGPLNTDLPAPGPWPAYTAALIAAQIVTARR